MKKIVLASQSPRRRELMMKLDLPFSVSSADVDEVIDNSLDLQEEVKRLAYDKAKSVQIESDDIIVVGADTIVVLDNEVLGKPRSAENAKLMLTKLSGKTHQVLTGVCIINGHHVINWCSVSNVTFKNLSDQEIDNYVQTSEPLDKAGAYGLQDKGGLFVTHIDGDYYSIIGLPIAEVNTHILDLFNS